MNSNQKPYHVMSRCHNKEFFPRPLKHVWPIITEELYRVHKEHKLAIHGFILMGNHFHLLCHTPLGNLEKTMEIFLRRTSCAISLEENNLWGGRYCWSLIQSRRYYMEAYRYIFQNPVRAGLVEKVEAYKFSTLTSEVHFPLHSSLPMAFGGNKGELLWLNQKEAEVRDTF